MTSRLRTIRLKQGLAIGAVAVRARVGPGTILLIEKYGHMPRLDTQQKIARALGVEVGVIWPGEGRSVPTTAA